MNKFDSQRDFHKELKLISYRFANLISEMEFYASKATPGKQSALEPATISELDTRVAKWAAQYSTCLAAGGEIFLAANDASLLDVDGLSKLITLYRLKRFDPIALTPGNLFAMQCGGPGVEIENRDGTVSIVNKPRPGAPLQFLLDCEVTEYNAQKLKLQSLGSVVLAPEIPQLRHYVDYCERFTSNISGREKSPRGTFPHFLSRRHTTKTRMRETWPVR